RNRDTAALSRDLWAGWGICCPCNLATPPGSLNSSASSPLIGHRNCSSGEAHRRPITGEEVELGEVGEPSGRASRSREDRGSCRRVGRGGREGRGQDGRRKRG
ncbi:unnamed protein product, partial [Staurois parvus]